MHVCYFERTRFGVPKSVHGGPRWSVRIPFGQDEKSDRQISPAASGGSWKGSSADPWSVRKHVGVVPEVAKSLFDPNGEQTDVRADIRVEIRNRRVTSAARIRRRRGYRLLPVPQLQNKGPVCGNCFEPLQRSIFYNLQVPTIIFGFFFITSYTFSLIFFITVQLCINIAKTICNYNAVHWSIIWNSIVVHTTFLL